MTKKLGIRKTGIIAMGLAVMLLTGTSMAVYATVTRPSPEVFTEVLEDGTRRFRIGTHDADEYGSQSMAVIVTEDGHKFVGYSKECLPEEWQSQLEASGIVQFTVDEDGIMTVGEGGIVIVNEDGTMTVGKHGEVDRSLQSFSVVIDRDGNIVTDSSNMTVSDGLMIFN